MLEPFDWLRRSRTGAELLATLRYLAAGQELPQADAELGPPPGALNGPCWRCWFYPRIVTERGTRYCQTCQTIVDEARRFGVLSPDTVVVWGFVSRLPPQLRPLTARSRPGKGGGQAPTVPAAKAPPGEPSPASAAGPDAVTAVPTLRISAQKPTPLDTLYFPGTRVLGAYILDERHFLLMLPQRELRPWLQELVLRYGGELTGLLQVFPTTGARDPGMGDLLALVIHQEARYPLDRLRVRFFASHHQIFHPDLSDRAGVLTFEIAEFMNTLELVSVFRSILQPDEQQELYRLLHKAEGPETQFLWGRFLGALRPEARDMLVAFNIRRWSRPQITLLYTLMDYVGFRPLD